MRALGSRPRGTIVLSSLVLYTTALVVLHVHDYSTLSPIDELQHVDSMIKWSNGEAVHRGDRVGQEAMREEACRGVEFGQPPPCGSEPYHPRDFREEGYNTAYIHPPLYYVLTGTGARAIGLTGDHSIVTDGRLMGIIWLDLAVVLIWLLLAEFGVSYAARAVLIVLAVTTPVVIRLSSIINPDAAALAAGAAVLLALVRWERGAQHWLVPAVLAAGCVFLKSSFATGAGVAMIYIVFRVIQRTVADDSMPGPTRRDYLRVLIGMAAGLAVASGIWVIAQNVLARVPSEAIPEVRRFRADEFPFHQLRGQLFFGVTPIQLPDYVPSVLDKEWVRNANDLVDVLLFVAVIGALIVSRAASRVKAIAAAALATMLLVGPAFVVVNYVFQHVVVVIPARYGLPLVPSVLVAGSALLRWRPVLIVVGVLAGLIALQSLTYLVAG